MNGQGRVQDNDLGANFAAGVQILDLAARVGRPADRTKLCARKRGRQYHLAHGRATDLRDMPGSIFAYAYAELAEFILGLHALGKTNQQDLDCIDRRAPAHRDDQVRFCAAHRIGRAQDTFARHVRDAFVEKSDASGAEHLADFADFVGLAA